MQMFLDTLKEFLAIPTVTIIIGAFLAYFFTSRREIIQQRSTLATERRKQIQSTLSELLAQQHRLMDRLYEVFKDICDDEEQDQLGCSDDASGGRLPI